MTATEVDEDLGIQAVDPSWFETPAERLSHSGGTAPFFKLVMTDEGLEKYNAKGGNKINKDYWIGKDLSHAADEKDFYFNILSIRESGDESKDFTEGVGVLESFMFNYLGVLRTKTSDNGVVNDEVSNLLVMRNLRNNFKTFRMMDLKIGEKTAQAGWKGKSRLRAMKHHLMDGLSNSAAEGYRLAGFNGCPEVFDSMDPLNDILSKARESGADKNESGLKKVNSLHTMWGTEIDESSAAQAKRFMLNSLNGTSMIRYFNDLHMDGVSTSENTDHYTPIEVSEIVSHELMSQLIGLATSCHKVQIPQKWIGSSVAVVYDSGFFPDRTSEGDHEADIREKVICKIFDWGRSELLMAEEYEKMTPEDQADRKYFWDLYKGGLDRLSYNAARFYYNQFTKSSAWKVVTIKIMDFDSLSPDDYIGKTLVSLPDPSDAAAVEELSSVKSYTLGGSLATKFKKSTVSLSISWVEFPSNSRLLGAWRVTIVGASNLPPMDVGGTSDPYCMVTANTSVSGEGQQFHQRTCVKSKNLNPKWNESIDIPVCRTASLNSVLQTYGMETIEDEDTSKHFNWDKNFIFGRDTDFSEWWASQLTGGE